MGGTRTLYSRSTKLLAALFLFLIPAAHGLNLGLIAGDLKRHSSPLVIRKVSKLSPVFINIKTGLSKPNTLFLPKLQQKTLNLLESTKPTKKVTRSVLSPLLLPKLPLLPFLPVLPPVLPPILPGLPLLPLPILPPIPILPRLPLSSPFRTPLKPLRVPILQRLPRTALGSKVKLPNVPPIKIDKKVDILKKLLDLKRKGTLTTPEYIRFRKLLLK